MTDVDITQQPSIVFSDYSGYLLRRDDKLRWHRCWCKIDVKNFSIYTAAEADQMISLYPLERIITQFDPEISKVCDKEHCFSVANRGCSVGGEFELKDSKTSEKIYFAAYSEAELGGWKGAFNAVISILPLTVDTYNSAVVVGDSSPSVPQLLQAPSEPQTIESEQALFNKQQLPLPSLPTVVSVSIRVL